MSCRPAARAATTASGPKPLVTATTRTADGSPPACSMRSRTECSLSATPSLAEEGGDVEIVVTQVELFFGPGGVGEDVHRFGSGEDARGQVVLGAGRSLLPALEAGGDHRDPHLVAHVVVDDGPEDDVGVRMRHGVDDLGCLVDLEKSEVRAAGDVEDHAAGTFDRRLEQRRSDGRSGCV